MASPIMKIYHLQQMMIIDRNDFEGYSVEIMINDRVYGILKK